MNATDLTSVVYHPLGVIMFRSGIREGLARVTGLMLFICAAEPHALPPHLLTMDVLLPPAFALLPALRQGAPQSLLPASADDVTHGQRETGDLTLVVMKAR